MLMNVNFRIISESKYFFLFFGTGWGVLKTQSFTNSTMLLIALNSLKLRRQENEGTQILASKKRAPAPPMKLREHLLALDDSRYLHK